VPSLFQAQTTSALSPPVLRPTTRASHVDPQHCGVTASHVVPLQTALHVWSTQTPLAQSPSVLQPTQAPRAFPVGSPQTVPPEVSQGPLTKSVVQQLSTQVTSAQEVLTPGQSEATPHEGPMAHAPPLLLDAVLLELLLELALLDADVALDADEAVAADPPAPPAPDPPAPLPPPAEVELAPEDALAAEEELEAPLLVAVEDALDAACIEVDAPPAPLLETEPLHAVTLSARTTDPTRTPRPMCVMGAIYSAICFARKCAT
jgi:hypothetical protein